MGSIKCGQDLPPQGGYGAIQWERVPLKTLFTWKLTLGVWAAGTLAGLIAYYYNAKEVHKERVEMRSARNVLLPLLLAERDRAFLKQVRINRDEERELMKNVPDWEVGTYFGEPIYITMPNKFHEPHFYEFFAHADWVETNYRVLRRHIMS